MCGIFFIKTKLLHKDVLKNSFLKAAYRGPDDSKIVWFPKLEDKNSSVSYFIGFHRLAINGIDNKSNQPFYKNGVYLICNGEIYNYKQLYADLDLVPETNSDCEIIIDLYNQFSNDNNDGTEDDSASAALASLAIEYTLKMLDGVFAFTLIDINKNVIINARDPLGVRPMFYYQKECEFYSSSELKQISDLIDDDEIKQFPPGSYSILTNNQLIFYNYFTLMNLSYPQIVFNDVIDMYSISKKIVRNMLLESVRKRLLSDRPIACLLSGGLDSSLIASIVCSLHNKQIETFSIGLEGSPDLKYARIVADHLKTKHHEIVVTENEFLKNIPEVIRRIESYDTTTVRASVGNCLIGKYISENSSAKVIFNGDGADELMGGYLYFHKCDNNLKFDNECRKLLENISYFDVLRSDRCISSWGLEPRTPFLDKSFVTLYLGLPLDIRFQKGELEKKLIRDAFGEPEMNYLPKEILYRKKEAFSDGVSNESRSWYKIIQEHLEKPKYKNYFDESSNLTKEQQYYKKIFEEYYPNKTSVIPYYWMPKWTNTTDPSARTL